MTAISLNIDTNIFQMAQSISDKMGFAYVGDFVSNLLRRETLVNSAVLELDKKLQVGFDSGFVRVNEKFWSDWEKELGVVKSDYAN